MRESLLRDTKITRVANSAAAGTSDVDGSVLDMGAAAAVGGFDAVLAIALLGDVTATSVLSLEWRESVNSDGTSSTQVPNSKTTDFVAGASDADAKILVSDTIRPTKRYVFPRLKRGTANAVVDGIIAIQYRGRNLPAVQGSTILASALAGPSV